MASGENVLPTTGVFSVGHSNHEPEPFVRLLRMAGVTAVADVRSSPYSRRLPHFNSRELSALLRRHGLAYVFLGDLLGGRPAPEELYDAEGRVDYEKVRQTDFFRRGLERLIRGGERYAVAMLCGEADPLECHRGLMITPALVEQGVFPLHVRRDGSLETTPEMENRLLRETGSAGLIDGLFAPTLSADERAQCLAEAYRIQATRKGFRRTLVEEGGE